MGRRLSSREVQAFDRPLSPDEQQWPATDHPVWMDQIASMASFSDKETRLSRMNAGNRFQLEQAELCRHMIVCYLTEAKSASVRNISEALEITKQSVRDHLAKLSAEGRVKPTSTFPREWVAE